jgi:alginate O-acetyltransferase complex protein AlgI
MGLTSPLFWILFPLFFIVYRLLAARPLPWAKCGWLLLASIGFLLAKDPAALVVLVILAVLTYVAAQRIANTNLQFERRLWLILPVCVCIAALVTSKLNSQLSLIGISFFTLQMVGYLLDVSRGLMPPEANFWIYLTSLLAFPYLTAGPLPKATRFMPQLVNPARLTTELASEAMMRISAGLAKKTAGDLLGVISDRYFDHGGGGSTGFQAWTATFALAGYYYADFSGYSDIAIGLCQLLGLQLPENFRCPYFATSVADHWRRWHISVNEWFREYLFMPLYLKKWPSPFSRFIKGGKARTNAALIVTMALIGLWHGLTLNNFLWGLYNGILILLPLPFGLAKPSLSGGRRAFAMGLTFYLILVGRVLTRTSNPSQAWAVWRQMHSFSNIGYLSTDGVLLFFFVTLGLILPHLIDWYIFVRPGRLANRYLALLLTIVFIAFTLCFSMQGRPFLYEKF